MICCFLVLPYEIKVTTDYKIPISGLISIGNPPLVLSKFENRTIFTRSGLRTIKDCINFVATNSVFDV